MYRLKLNIADIRRDLAAQGIDTDADTATDIYDAVTVAVFRAAEAQGIDTDEHADALLGRADRLAVAVMRA